MRRYEPKQLNYDEAKEKALRLLEFRSHSEKEIYTKLTHSGADEDVTQSVIDFLKEYKLINDYDYAKRYALDLQNLKKFGKNRIKTQLMSKGISDDIIDEVMSELPTPEDDALYTLIKKRLKGELDKKNRDKIMRYFIYRGYSPDEIKKCLSRIEGELE